MIRGVRALLQINLQMRAMISYDGGDTSGCDEMIAHLNEVYAIEQRNRRRMQKKVEREEERDEKVGYLSFRTEEDFLAFGFKPTFTRFRWQGLPSTKPRVQNDPRLALFNKVEKLPWVPNIARTAENGIVFCPDRL